MTLSSPKRPPERCRQREATIEFADDSPAEETVTCELVSAAKFPANREEYREFHRFWHLPGDLDWRSARGIIGLQQNSLHVEAGNFGAGIREAEGASSETNVSV
jgi:hypothetical protein